MEHIAIPLGEIHKPHNWEFNDAVARLAYSGAGSDDLGAWALQLDDGSYWRLTVVSPITWVQIKTDPNTHGHTEASTGAAGFMSAADKTKLDGVEASANNYTHPANHAPSIIAQDASNRFVSDAEKAAWDAKQPAGNYATGGGTATGTNTGDQTTITGNAGTATALQTPRNINGVAFDGSANITINAVDSTARVASSLLGVADGVATLDSGGKVPAAQLPSYVDDVVESANLAALPGSGETGKIYVTLDNGKTYRWSGSAYVEISASPGSTDAVPEGSANLYHTVARVRDAVLTGLSTATNAVISATDTVLSALGKLQKQVSDTLTALGDHTADTTDAHAASAITNTAAGGLAATTVQAAINELDTEKAPKNEAVFTGSGTAPAVTITNTGTGPSLLVEDSASTDATPFTVDASGNLGVGTASPAKLVHVSAATDAAAVVRIQSTAAGASTIAQTNGGLELIAGDMNTTTTYTPMVKFGTADASITTVTPKFGAAIVAEAVETFSSDTTGRMSLSFWTSATTYDAAGTLTERVRITYSGCLAIGGSGSVAAGFYNQKSITGGTTAYANATFASVATDVTTAYGYYTSLSTDVSGPGLASLFHYRASQGTLSTAVTNQYGFTADSTLTGAVNNYGFFSSIISGTDRTITFVERTTNVATVTTSAAHGFLTGQVVVVAATTNTSFNSRVTITATPTTTTFTYANTGSDLASTADTGTVFNYARFAYYGSGNAPSYYLGKAWYNVSSTDAALRITQTGTGNAFVVEDSTSPDSSPFVIDSSGKLIQGHTTTFGQIGGTACLFNVAETGTQGNAVLGKFRASTSDAELTLLKSRSAIVGTNTVVVADDGLGTIKFGGADGTNYIEAVQIRAYVDGTPGQTAGTFTNGLSYKILTVGTTDFTLIGAASNTVGVTFTATGAGTGTGTAILTTGDMPGRVVISTTPDGSATPAEHMRVSADGSTRLTASSAATVALLDLQGNNTSAAATNTLRFTDTDTTTAADQQIGKLEFYSSDAAPTAGVRANIAVVADSATDSLASIRFSTQSAADGVLAEKVRINTTDTALTTHLVVPKTTNYGIKVGTAASNAFGWRDITTQIEVRGTGAADPTFATYGATVMRQYSFSATTEQEVFLVLHIPHDYVPGTDIHLHAHWSNAAATPNTGNVVWGFDYAFAKGFNQAAFPALTTITVTQACPATRYQHNIAETAAITIAALEVDGLLLVRGYRKAADAADTCTDAVFLHTIDAHYQSSNMATSQKSPNPTFYS